MVQFVGAGCGAADLITLRGKKLLEQADVIIYAGSLVNPELLQYAKKECAIYNSAYMTLDEVFTAPFGNRWIGSERCTLTLQFAPVSVLSAAQQPHCKQNTPCPMFLKP